MSSSCNKTVTCTLPDHLSSIGKELATGHMLSIADSVIRNDELVQLIWQQHFLKVIDQECSVLCQRQAPSLFRSIPISRLHSFKWKDCIDDLSAKAPTLMSLLSKVVSHSDHRNEKKTTFSHFPGVCMATAVLLKERNREMCGIQTLNSLILYSSHAEKQV